MFMIILNKLILTSLQAFALIKIFQKLFKFLCSSLFGSSIFIILSSLQNHRLKFLEFNSN